MNDRELIEAAAKAAGLNVLSRPEYAWPALAIEVEYGHDSWDPLNDDGDALRLAVKLDLSPSIFTVPGLTICTATNKPMSEVNIEVEHNGDPCSATRRAIVRAAAALHPNGGSTP